MLNPELSQRQYGGSAHNKIGANVLSKVTTIPRIWNRDYILGCISKLYQAIAPVARPEPI